MFLWDCNRKFWKRERKKQAPFWGDGAGAKQELSKIGASFSIQAPLVFATVLLLASPVLCEPQENFPPFLLGPQEMLPGWQITRGTFVLGKRGFVYCRGKEFRGPPPETPGFQERYQGKVFRSLGAWSNGVLATIEQANLIDEKSKFEAAQKKLEQMEGRVAGFWAIHFNLARLYYLLHDYKKSISYWKRVLAATPNSPSAHFHLALAASSASEDTLAKVHFQKAIKLDPKQSRFLVGLGDFYFQRHSFFHADLYYQKALKQNRASVPAILGKARLLIRKGEKNRARKILRNFLIDHYGITSLEEMQKKAPENLIPLLYYLSELHYALRDYKRALVGYQILLKHPGSSVYLWVSQKSIQKRIHRARFREQKSLPEKFP